MCNSNIECWVTCSNYSALFLLAFAGITATGSNGSSCIHPCKYFIALVYWGKKKKRGGGLKAISDCMWFWSEVVCFVVFSTGIILTWNMFNKRPQMFFLRTLIANVTRYNTTQIMCPLLAMDYCSPGKLFTETMQVYTQSTLYGSSPKNNYGGWERNRRHSHLARYFSGPLIATPFCNEAHDLPLHCFICHIALPLISFSARTAFQAALRARPFHHSLPFCLFFVQLLLTTSQFTFTGASSCFWYSLNRDRIMAHEVPLLFFSHWVPCHKSGRDWHLVINNRRARKICGTASVLNSNGNTHTSLPYQCRQTSEYYFFFMTSVCYCFGKALGGQR